MRILPALALAASVAFGAGCAASPAKQARAAQRRAPDFTLTDSDGRAVSLHDVLRRGPVILAFFPKAFTAG